MHREGNGLRRALGFFCSGLSRGFHGCATPFVRLGPRMTVGVALMQGHPPVTEERCRWQEESQGQLSEANQFAGRRRIELEGAKAASRSTVGRRFGGDGRRHAGPLERIPRKGYDNSGF